jgi:Xaa-Pro aminopeptidase
MQRSLIDVTKMNRDEIDWLNAYHARCRATLTPLINDANVVEWLRRSTEPL